MDYFTQLMIFYPLGGHDMVASVWFETWEACERVLRSGAFDVIYADPKDIHVGCEQSDVASGSIRPRMRPENG